MAKQTLYPNPVNNDCQSNKLDRHAFLQWQKAQLDKSIFIV